MTSKRQKLSREEGKLVKQMENLLLKGDFNGYKRLERRFGKLQRRNR